MPATFRTAAFTAAAALLSACAPHDAAPTDVAEVVSIPVYEARSHATHLTGDQEVPPVDTKAVGEFVMKLSDDRQSISFRLIASNIIDVNQAHIHRRAPGALTGGVVVWLYPAASPPVLIPGRSSGVLSEGTFTSANFVGFMAGKTMAEFLTEVAAGRTYANVHTVAHPAGEIRGDIIP